MPLICRLALDAGLINEKQAARAAALHEKILASGKDIPLERILVKAGAISQETAEKLKISAIRKLDKTFCETAVKKGLLTREDADAALNQQAKIFKESRDCVTAAEILQNAGQLDPAQAEALLHSQGRSTNTCADQSATKKPKPTPENTGPASAAAPKRASAHRQIHGLNLKIFGDPPAARLFYTEIPAKPFSLDDVKTLLADHHVIHGIIADETITEFLHSPAQDKEITVAESTSPTAGKDAAIRYNFDTGIQNRIGARKNDGKIDYKERGIVPKVEAGQVIAEKIPATSGKDGMNIYGNPIAASPGRDVELRTAHGVHLSEDHMQAIADSHGEPRLSFSGKLSVSGDHHVEAVNIKTGHVTFEGNIIVKTVIENGFKVKGGSVKAAEVFAATIDSAGDVTVSGGISGATINAQCSVSAKYLKNARIMAYGDVIIKKEIIDSVIITSGTCKIAGGKIISSQIIAKNSIQALQVGTDVSSPCRLKVGVDEHAEREMEAIETEIGEKEAEVAELQKEAGRLKKEEQDRHQDIAELAQEADNAHTAVRAKTSEREAAEAIGDSKTVQSLDKVIAECEEKAASASQALEILMDKQEQTEERLASIKTDTDMLHEAINDKKTQKTNIAEWVKQLAKTAVIHISGIAYEDTVFEGRHATLALPKNQSAIRVKEVKTTAPEKGTTWKISIKNQMRA